MLNSFNIDVFLDEIRFPLVNDSQENEKILEKRIQSAIQLNGISNCIRSLDGFPLNGGALVLSNDNILFLSIYVLKPKQTTAIHDHGMASVVGVIEGKSKNTTYPILTEKKIDVSNPIINIFSCGEVYSLDATIPHNDFNDSDDLLVEVHAYPGNVLSEAINSRRSLWDWNGNKEPYNHDRFFKLANQVRP